MKQTADSETLESKNQKVFNESTKEKSWATESEEKPHKRVTSVTLGSTVVACLVTLVAGFYVGLNWDNMFSKFKPYLGFKNEETNELNLKSLNSLYATLQENYDGDIDESTVIEGAKKGMVSSLGDEYTQYFNAQEASDYKASLEGDISEAGIGISFAKREDYPRVLRTLPDNPARKAGILAGDIIYAVDGKEVWEKSLEDISQILRGKEGTKVKVTVVRNNKKIDYELTREKINNVSADVIYKDNVAILSIYRFSQETGSEVKKLADEIIKKNSKAVILDLRNNGGGYVSAAKTVLSLWLDGDKILIQKSKTGGDESMNADRGEAVFKDMKTVALINSGTASASEIVVGALKDYGKATVVGETSFGKGVVQSMLSIGSDMLKVTTAHWYTPLDHSINKTGIEPDVKVERTYEQINKDEDPQLDKALELVK